jgi:hypothetical protein
VNPEIKVPFAFDVATNPVQLELTRASHLWNVRDTRGAFDYTIDVS